MLEHEWEEYADACIDPMTSPLARELLKNAFFAGATVMMSLQAKAFQTMAQDEAFDVMLQLNEECLAFMRRKGTDRGKLN